MLNKMSKHSPAALASSAETVSSANVGYQFNKNVIENNLETFSQIVERILRHVTDYESRNMKKQKKEIAAFKALQVEMEILGKNLFFNFRK